MTKNWKDSNTAHSTRSKSISTPIPSSFNSLGILIKRAVESLRCTVKEKLESETERELRVTVGGLGLPFTEIDPQLLRFAEEHADYELLEEYLYAVHETRT